jgi:hypothetical protein
MTSIELDGYQCERCGHGRVKQQEQQRFFGASTNTTSTKANEYKAKPRPAGNSWQYNLMRRITGGQPITSWDDDTPHTEPLKYYAGSSTNEDKVSKTYELMKWVTS